MSTDAEGDAGEAARSPFEERVQAREVMVRDQIERRGVQDPVVLQAMRRVPRHAFVSADQESRAYADHPLPIGRSQTISQPYIVGLMTEAVRPRPGDRILEIGAGCGYQTAVLLECGAVVYAIELEPELAALARRNLDALGYDKVYIRAGDGSGGWPEEAPFDGIFAAAAAPRLPEGLTDQLAPGGRMVLPIGTEPQTLTRFERTPDGIVSHDLGAVRFVPLRATRPPENPPDEEPSPP